MPRTVGWRVECIPSQRIGNAIIGAVGILSVDLFTKVKIMPAWTFAGAEIAILRFDLHLSFNLSLSLNLNLKMAGNQTQKCEEALAAIQAKLDEIKATTDVIVECSDEEGWKFAVAESLRTTSDEIRKLREALEAHTTQAHPPSSIPPASDSASRTRPRRYEEPDERASQRRRTRSPVGNVSPLLSTGESEFTVVSDPWKHVHPDAILFSFGLDCVSFYPMLSHVMIWNLNWHSAPRTLRHHPLLSCESWSRPPPPQLLLLRPLSTQQQHSMPYLQVTTYQSRKEELGHFCHCSRAARPCQKRRKASSSKRWSRQRTTYTLG